MIRLLSEQRETCTCALTRGQKKVSVQNNKTALSGTDKGTHKLFTTSRLGRGSQVSGNQLVYLPIISVGAFLSLTKLSFLYDFCAILSAFIKKKKITINTLMCYTY